MVCVKIHKFNFENKQIIQIYITKEEQEKSKVIEKISELKKRYSNIAVFISGENETIKTIKDILNYKKNKQLHLS